MSQKPGGQYVLTQQAQPYRISVPQGFEGRLTSIQVSLVTGVAPDYVHVYLNDGDQNRILQANTAILADLATCEVGFGIGLDQTVPLAANTDPVSGDTTYHEQEVAVAPLPDQWFEGENFLRIETANATLLVLAVVWEQRRLTEGARPVPIRRPPA